jgi:hypothetical protein
MTGVQYDDPNREAVGLEPVWVEGDGGGAEPPPEGGLDAMTKAELLDHAKAIGASPANSDMTKDEIRASIDEKESEA